LAEELPCYQQLSNKEIEADIIQGLLKKNKKKLARSFKFTFHYRDGVVSLTNSGFVDGVDHMLKIVNE
jgi:hypothetical protein